jgi:hypothetical protein
VDLLVYCSVVSPLCHIWPYENSAEDGVRVANSNPGATYSAEGKNRRAKILLVNSTMHNIVTIDQVRLMLGARLRHKT